MLKVKEEVKDDLYNTMSGVSGNKVLTRDLLRDHFEHAWIVFGDNRDISLYFLEELSELMSEEKPFGAKLDREKYPLLDQDVAIVELEKEVHNRQTNKGWSQERVDLLISYLNLTDCKKDIYMKEVKENEINRFEKMEEGGEEVESKLAP